MELARALQGFSVECEGFDLDPTKVGLRNGVFDLDKRELIEQHPELYLTKHLNINFDPEATCPIFLAFLNQVLGDEDCISYIQRAIGYTLSGSGAEQVMFILYGRGANGKSVFLSVLTHLLGMYALSAPPQMLARRQRSSTNDIARLNGVRLLTLSEEAAGGSLDVTMVKQLTGGDKIAARQLYKENEEFVSVAKMWMATNHLPELVEADHGTWRRIRIIPFNRQISPDMVKRNLLTELISELPGIFNWAVEGYRKWECQGLGHSDLVSNATDNYRSSADPLYTWLKRRTSLDNNSEHKAREIFESYLEFCFEGDVSGVSERRFFSLLQQHGYAKMRKSDGMYYRGLRLVEKIKRRRRRSSA